jgi:hypothetical protein
MGQIISLNSVKALGKHRAEQAQINLALVAQLSPEDKNLLLAKLLLNLRAILEMDAPAQTEKHKSRLVIAVNFQRDGDPVEARRSRRTAKPHRAGPARLQETPS